MACEIVLVRHGESIWKTLNKTQGQLDSKLTEKGKKQAIDFINNTEMKHFDFIASSPLGRALETAEIFRMLIGYENVLIIDELKERYEGALEGLSREEQIRRYPNLFNNDRKLTNDIDIPFSEPLESFYNRVQIGIEKISKTGLKCIAVTHSGVIQAVKYLFNKTGNCSLGFSKVAYLESISISM